MEAFSALLVLCAGNSPVTGEFPAKRPVTRSFDIFIDLRLNKRRFKRCGAHVLWSLWSTHRCFPANFLEITFQAFNIRGWVVVSDGYNVSLSVTSDMVDNGTIMFRDDGGDYLRGNLADVIDDGTDQVSNAPPGHDDVIKWKYIPRNWPFVQGIHRSPVNSPHKGQCRRALMCSLIWAWINGRVVSREAGVWKRHRTHYDVTVMISSPH